MEMRALTVKNGVPPTSEIGGIDPRHFVGVKLLADFREDRIIVHRLPAQAVVADVHRAARAAGALGEGGERVQREFLPASHAVGEQRQAFRPAGDAVRRHAVPRNRHVAHEHGEGKTV